MTLIQYIIECEDGYTFSVYADNTDEAHAEAHTILNHEDPSGFSNTQFTITEK